MIFSSGLLALGFTGWLVVFVVFLLTRWLFTRRSDRNAPPGPISLPIVGSLLSLSEKDMRKSLAKLTQKYGDVMQLDLGLTKVVVLSSYDAMKQSLLKQGHLYAFRPQSMVADCRKELGVVAQNAHWNDQRRFILHTFRNFGFGKNKMEQIIKEELSMLITEVAKLGNRSDNVFDIFSKINSIIILRLVFGREFSYDDPLLKEHSRVVAESTTVAEKVVLTNCFPFLKHMPYKFSPYKQLESLFMELRAIAIEWIEERKKTINYVDEPRDVIEAYLQYQNTNKDSASSGFTDEMLIWHVIDLHAAAVDTTSVTLTFAVYFMVLHPDIQAKVHAEIDDVIGGRQPCLRDRSSMPYTEAVMSEVQRLADVLPLSLPHSNSDQTEIKGYTIPQWTYIMMNIHSVHGDPKLWENPELFDPNRFLDSFGKFAKREELIPFGIGKRNCLGETLARSELFLIFVGVMQHFTFRTPEGGTKPDPDGTMGLIMHPKPADIHFEPRHPGGTVGDA